MTNIHSTETPRRLAGWVAIIGALLAWSEIGVYMVALGGDLAAVYKPAVFLRLPAPAHCQYSGHYLSIGPVFETTIAPRPENSCRRYRRFGARFGPLKAAKAVSVCHGRECGGWPLQAHRRRVRAERAATLQHKHHPVVWPPRNCPVSRLCAYRNPGNTR